MEFDDLKRLWEAYDKKLGDNLRLNEELLRRSNLDRSRRAMRAPSAMHWLDVAVIALYVPFILVWTIRYGREPLFLVCGGISIAFFLYSLIWSDIRGLGMLRRMDFYNSSVVTLQRQLADYDRFSHRGRKFSLFILPPAIFALLVIVNKGLVGVNLLDRPLYFTIVGIVCLALGYPLIIWMWRNLFDKKVAAAHRHLAELEEFERE
jgi:hypothetical protein